MPKVEVELDLQQLARILVSLESKDLETLEILMDKELSEELLKRKALAEQEREEGKLLTLEDLFR